MSCIPPFAQPTFLRDTEAEIAREVIDVIERDVRTSLRRFVAGMLEVCPIEEPVLICCGRCGGAGVLPARKGPLPVCPDCHGSGEGG